MNLKNIKGVIPVTKIQKETIIFSSDDSMNSDNSFNSSIEEEEGNNYQNSIFHLKEQMNQFFLQNPNLQEAIKFEPIDYEQVSNDQTIIKSKQASRSSSAVKQVKVQVKEVGKGKVDLKNFSQSWKVLGKDVIRNSQGGQTLPTLETINHRLNIFKQKIEKVDYMEILSKETLSKQPEDAQKIKQNEKSQNGRAQSLNSKQRSDEHSSTDDHLQFFSFKKKMQMALQQRQQLQAEEEQLKNKAIQDKQKNKDNGLGLGIDDSNVSQSQQKLNNKLNDQNGLGVQMEFKTHVGQMLYQTFLQTGNDKDSFKKMASIFLKNYHKKQKESLDKLKIFPPVIPKFTSEDCKHLNLLLPDFTTHLYAPNKQNIFQNSDGYKFPQNSSEQEFINLIDHILEGKVMQFWKELHKSQ